LPGASLNPGGEFVGGEVDSDLVAMGGLQPATLADRHDGGESIGLIRQMRVDPALQRRGFGTRILDYLEARAPEPGFERPVPDATHAQPAALVFYESHGYRETDREPSPARETVYFE